MMALGMPDGIKVGGAVGNTPTSGTTPTKSSSPPSATVASHDAPDGISERYQKLFENRTCKRPGLELGSPQYVHQDKIYWYSNPYFRIEGAGCYISLVLKGIYEDETPEHAAAAYYEIRDGDIRHRFGASAVRAPISDVDLKNPLVRRLVEKGYIIPEVPSPRKAAIAKQIAQIHASNIYIGNKPNQGTEILEENMAPQGGYVAGSNGAKIGTTGLGPCVAVILYDERSRSGTVFHVDPNMPISDTISEIVSQMRKSGAGEIYARLVGGWSGYSEKAIFYIRRGLSDSGVVIKGEDILGDGRSRHNVILDTTDGSLAYETRYLSK